MAGVATALLCLGCGALKEVWEARPQRRLSDTGEHPSFSQRGKWSDGLRWEFSVEPPMARPGERARLRVGFRNTTDEAVEVDEDIFGHVQLEMRGVEMTMLGYRVGLGPPSKVTILPGEALERHILVYAHRPEPLALGGRKARIVCWVARKEGYHFFDLYRVLAARENLLGTVALKVTGEQELNQPFSENR